MLVSVIIASHNFGQYITEAVMSVLTQGVDDLEVIVVDDASTDDTRERLSGISDPRVRAEYLQKVGVGAARNHGLRLARGRFVGYLDADDRWCPGKLKAQIEVLRSEPDVGFVFTNFVRFDENGRHPNTQFDIIPELYELPLRESREGHARVIEADALVSLVATRQFPAWIQTALIRADCTRDIEFPEDMRLSQDYCYMLRIYSVARAAFIQEPLVEVRRHTANSYRRPEEKLKPDIDALTRVADEVRDAGQRDAVLRRLGRAYLSLGHHHFWRGEARPAVNAYFEAMHMPGSKLNALKHLAALPLMPLAPLWSRKHATSGR
jgi:glycosyltransferase involved in cell wall biosynthesis